MLLTEAVCRCHNLCLMAWESLGIVAKQHLELEMPGYWCNLTHRKACLKLRINMLNFRLFLTSVVCFIHLFFHYFSYLLKHCHNDVFTIIMFITLLATMRKAH